MSSHDAHGISKLSSAGVLITLGIIFGDIGTSPLYVMKAIIGTSVINKELVYGGVSCVFWTLLIITTFKYVYLALNADNKGEGGIFALYALIRRYKSPWVIVPALIGCASLIADGFITPPISISSAIEGLKAIYPSLETDTIVKIVITILIVIFVFQQVGTAVVGKTFGPIMVLWFSMLMFLGFRQIGMHPDIILAFNPYYAYNLICNYSGGFWILGSVFLCTTGGEALYSDLGHCGKQNVRVSWGFVLFALLINYLGQAAFLVNNYDGQVYPAAKSVFYGLVPDGYLPYAIAIAASAAIIASQALITGTFTLVNEAMKLHLWINMKVNYPTQLRGQIYIPGINWFLLAGCIGVVLYFKESTNMEAAYGLAIIINMIMTTTLLCYYLWIKKHNIIKVAIIGVVLMLIECSFFVSNMLKFSHGGWVSLLIAIALFIPLYVLYRARKLRQNYTEFVPLRDYVEVLKSLQDDETIPKEATNLVYLTLSSNKNQIDANIIYSILKKRPKRADIYWFVHVDILDEPYAKKYHVDTIEPGKIFFVHLKFGFKVEHKVNRMFHNIVERMIQNGEVDEMSRYPSLRKHGMTADFKFMLLHTRVSIDNEISPVNQFIIRFYRILKRMSLSTQEDFGLEVANVETEVVPINIAPPADIKMEREHH